MKNQKRILSFVLAFTMIFATFAYSEREAQAATYVTVFLNSKLVQFENIRAQIVNDKTMVPARELFEKMGATVNWNDADKKVTIVLGDKYAVLGIGNSIMNTGTLTTDATGKLLANDTPTAQQLPAAPVIIDERTLFPSREIAEFLGAKVIWNDDSKSVFITTDAATVAPVEATPTPTPKPTLNPILQTSDYFEVVSGRRVEDMHVNKAKFIVAIFDGTDVAALDKISQLKASGEAAKIKVYGVDLTSTAFSSPDFLQFPWLITEKSSAMYPIVIMSYEGKLDEVLPSDISQSTMTDKFKNLALDHPNVATTSPSASPTATATPTTTPTTSPTATPSTVYDWKELTIAESTTKQNNKDKFVYLVYDSSTTYDSSTVDNLKAFAKENKYTIYVTDLRYETQNDINLLWAYAYITGDKPNPTIFLAKDNSVKETLPYTMDKTSIERQITDFFVE